MKYTLLSSLAFLKVNSDSNNGIFIDNFIPFIVHSIKKLKEEIVSVTDLQDILLQEFGLCIPQSVVKTLLYRAKKIGGYVKLEDHIFYKVKSKLDEFVFSSVQEKVGRIYSALIVNFISYSQTKFGVTFSDEEAEQAILSFINYNQPYFYKHIGDETIIPKIPSVSTDKKFIVADYIYDAKQNKPDVYDYLDTVIKGYMIANVLYLPDAHETNKKFFRTKVFLDTSFIIHALGYDGEQLRVPCLELLELLYKNNAKICCFQHTVEEIEGILAACSHNLGNLSNSPYRRSAHYFISAGYSASDIKLLISHLKNNIQRLRIEIVPTPDYNYDKHRYVIDEAAFFDYLKSNIVYPRDEAAYKDVASISAIYRLRKNNYSSYLEECSAVFVTTNTTLTTVSNDFFFKSNDENIAPPCVTDFFLTNLLWLKTPNHAPDLPMKRIIADSYAAIQPDDKLMARWINEIQKLETKGEPITEEDYYFIRSSNEIHQALMEITRGDVDAITIGNVPYILERAKEIVRQDIEKKYLDESDKRKETEAAFALFQTGEKRREEEREIRLRDKSRNIAKKTTQLLRIVTIIVLVIGVVITLPLNLITPEELLSNTLFLLPKFLISIFLLLMLILGVANQYFGTTLKSWLNSLEIYIENKIYSFLSSLAN